VELGNRRGEPTVHLFGERLVLVVGAQPRLYMPERDFVIERRQRGDEGGGRVPLRQHNFSGRLAQHSVQPLQRAQGNLGQRLVGGHDVQVHIGRQVKQAQHLVEHLAMLPCGNKAHDESGMFAQRTHHGRHLDGVGARAAHGKHANRATHAVQVYPLQNRRRRPVAETPPTPPTQGMLCLLQLEQALRRFE
jgi:hypothetical protein